MLNNDDPMQNSVLEETPDPCEDLHISYSAYPEHGSESMKVP